MATCCNAESVPSLVRKYFGHTLHGGSDVAFSLDYSICRNRGQANLFHACPMVVPHVVSDTSVSTLMGVENLDCFRRSHRPLIHSFMLGGCIYQFSSRGSYVSIDQVGWTLSLLQISNAMYIRCRNSLRYKYGESDSSYRRKGL